MDRQAATTATKMTEPTDPRAEATVDNEYEASKPSEKPFVSRLLAAFPPWVRDNLRSSRSWKMLIRCWIATWASLVVILPQRSLSALGNTAFFTLLASLMIPPSMPVQTFIFVISMLITGQLLGWALGAAVMKAATSARDQILLRTSYQAAEQTAATAANPDTEFTLEVFRGAFLDVRSSVVYGVLFAFFSFIFALGRAYRPQLLLLFIFGQIVFDIICTFGPLLPATQYTIVSSLLISMSVYMAIGIVCCLLIFPETMNHSYLDKVAVLLGQLKSYSGLYESILAMSPEEIPDDPHGAVERCTRQRMELILTMQDLQEKGGLINAEFSFGRWNGSDARALEDHLRVVVVRMASFYSYPKLLSNTSSRSLSRSTTNSGEKAEDEGSLSIHSSEEIAGDTELIRQLNSRRYALELENNVRMIDIMPSLLDSTSELRVACLQALGTAQEYILLVNHTRWTRNSSAINEKEVALNQVLERLNTILDSYKSEDRLAIITPFSELLHAADKDQHKRKHLPIRPLIVASSFAAQLIVTIEGIINLLELIIKTAHKRQKARLWAPKGLRALGNFIIRRRKDTALDITLGENTIAELEEEENSAPYRHDPDSKPPTNFFQKIMNSVYAVYKWSKSPQAIFAIKYTILSVLIWLPAAIRNSSYFYYIEKGVWALIMAQTSINVFASDTIYSIVARTIGTFAGLVLGLIIWYIGNGNGNGNPYGLAASYGVLIIPVLFVRINAPPVLLQPFIMFNVTLALVVGYSWIDAKLNVVGNPGLGWPIAWKRFVLVVIGIGAAAVIMLFPPVSGRKAVRLQNAAVISELSSIYSSLMSVWIEENEVSPRPDDIRHEQKKVDNGEAGAEILSMPSSIANTAKLGWAVPLRNRILGLVGQLQSIKTQTVMAKFEGNIRGAWPAKEYAMLLERESDMLAALGLLSVALQKLDPTWRSTLIRRTMILNPNFIADVMSIFALVSQSLRTGEPMHQILPSSLLDRLLYHHTHDILSRNEPQRQESVSYLERTRSLEFTFYCTGVTAVWQIIEALDDIHRIVRGLCGEIPFRGFNEWKNDYDQSIRPP